MWAEPEAGARGGASANVPVGAQPGGPRSSSGGVAGGAFCGGAADRSSGLEGEATGVASEPPAALAECREAGSGGADG